MRPTRPLNDVQRPGFSAPPRFRRPSPAFPAGLPRRSARRRSGSRLIVLSLALAAAPGACKDSTGGGPPEPAPVPVARVIVTPAADTLLAGASRQETATLFDAQGNHLTGRTVTWSSSDSTHATVSNSGLVTAIAGATTPVTITATSGGVSGSSTLTISPNDTTCARATLRPTGRYAGFGSFRRYQGDFHPPDTIGDYRYLGGSRGLINGTLQYLGCRGDRSLWLEWEYNDFMEVAVRNPYGGTTDRGLKLGDDLATFRALYPEAVHATEWFTVQTTFEFWVAGYPDGALTVALRDGRVAMMGASWWLPWWTGSRPDPNNILGPYLAPHGWDWTASPPLGVILRPTVATLGVGQSLDFTGYVTSFSSVDWASSNASVATVDPSGLARGVGAGTATITVRAASAPSHGARAAVTVFQITATALSGGVPVPGLSGEHRSQRFFKITVPAGATRLEVRTQSGTGDPDLHVQFNAYPTPYTTSGATTCYSGRTGTTETCTLTNPPAGEWGILLYGNQAYSGVTLTATTAP